MIVLSDCRVTHPMVAFISILSFISVGFFMSQCIQSFQYRVVLLVSIVAVGVLLSGCVDRTGKANTATIKASPLTCIKGEPMTQTTLYFGLNRPHGPIISATEWQSFVSSEIGRAHV